MNKNAKKMYVAPSIKEHVVELEQGIAAASTGSVDSASPSINDSEGNGQQSWETSSF